MIVADLAVAQSGSDALILRHVRGAFENNTFIYSETWRRDGSPKDGRRVHYNFASRKKISLDASIDNNGVGFDLGLNFCAFIYNDGVLSEDFALENATNLYGALKRQAPLEGCARVKNSSDLINFVGFSCRFYV